MLLLKAEANIIDPQSGGRPLNRGEELRRKWSHLSTGERSALLEQKAEANAYRLLQEMEAATPGAHFLSRRSANTTLHKQLVSAATGLRPDGRIMGFPKKRFAVDSTRSLSNRDMLYGINRAQRIQQYAISQGRPIEGYISFRFDRFVGDGFLKNTPLFGADLSRFYRRTDFANFGVSAETGKAIAAFPVLSTGSLGELY